MIKTTPVTYYKMEFEKGKQLPLYYLYTLLGQEYLIFSEEPHLLKDRGDDPEDVLDMLHTALNGFPRTENIYSDNVRAFEVCYGSGDEKKIVRIAFSINDDTLSCALQRAHRTNREDSTKSCTCTHTTYDSPYRFTWDWEDIVHYGFIEEGDDLYD